MAAHVPRLFLGHLNIADGLVIVAGQVEKRAADALDGWLTPFEVDSASAAASRCLRSGTGRVPASSKIWKPRLWRAARSRASRMLSSWTNGRHPRVATIEYAGSH